MFDYHSDFVVLSNLVLFQVMPLLTALTHQLVGGSKNLDVCKDICVLSAEKPRCSAIRSSSAQNTLRAEHAFFYALSVLFLFSCKFAQRNLFLFILVQSHSC